MQSDPSPLNNPTRSSQSYCDAGMQEMVSRQHAPKKHSCSSQREWSPKYTPLFTKQNCSVTGDSHAPSGIQHAPWGIHSAPHAATTAKTSATLTQQSPYGRGAQSPAGLNVPSPQVSHCAIISSKSKIETKPSPFTSSEQKGRGIEQGSTITLL